MDIEAATTVDEEENLQMGALALKIAAYCLPWIGGRPSLCKVPRVHEILHCEKWLDLREERLHTVTVTARRYNT